MTINRLLLVGLCAACTTAGVAGYVSMREQNEPLLRKLQSVHHVPDAQMAEVRRIFTKSGYIGQGNPAVTRHPATTEQCEAKLKGLNVYNQKDESIGEITDLAIKNHQVDALILSVGGFLGMGEHYVAVSPSSVNVRYDQKNDKWLASMNTTKDALKAAPEFKYPK